MSIQFNPFQLQEMQAQQSQGNLLMNFLQNAVLQKISQNFQEKQLAMDEQKVNIMQQAKTEDTQIKLAELGATELPAPESSGYTLPTEDGTQRTVTPDDYKRLGAVQIGGKWYDVGGGQPKQYELKDAQGNTIGYSVKIPGQKSQLIQRPDQKPLSMSNMEAKFVQEQMAGGASSEEAMRKLAEIKKNQNTTNININNTPSTQTDIQKQLMEADEVLRETTGMEQYYKPEFNTYSGQLQAWIGGKAEKLGMEPPDKKLLEDYSKWKMSSMRGFLKWRKWITGVAGGEREMEQIAKSFYNPETDSPTEFQAKVQAMKDITQKAKVRLSYFSKENIVPTNINFDKYPLDLFAPEGSKNSTAEDFLKSKGIMR